MITPAKPIMEPIEFPGDHQQGRRHRQDPDLGRDVEDVDEPLHGEHAAGAGDGIEDGVDEEGAGQRSQFGAAEQARKQAGPLNARLVAPHRLAGENGVRIARYIAPRSPRRIAGARREP
jgi:hypothetical protein